MFSPETRDLLRDVIELFAKSRDLPISIYEIDDNGNMLETITAGDNQLPIYCHQVWALGQGAGRTTCMFNKSQRAEQAFKSVVPAESLCHAGLTTTSDPVVVDGKAIAVIQLGAFVVEDEDILQSRL